ncbi:uncharacterized protein [Anabrus simplex]|uniref:uncharacterized protein n=1 Tax=Anabrus simplex TaxID=316456 RepID=UPI0035A2668A
MCDMKSWTAEFVKEFILLYRSLPCLYDTRDEFYLNKPVKQVAYEKLVRKVREIEPNATRDTVTKKINNLRSSYRKERKKVERSKKFSDVGEIYKPSLWYYHLLDFLYEDGEPKDNFNTSSGGADGQEEDEIEVEEEKYSMISLQDIPAFSEPAEESSLQAVSLAPPVSTAATPEAKRRKTDQPTESETVKLPPEARLSLYSTYGAYIAEELRNLPPDMAIYCQKLINDAIFEARCGTLSRYSKIVTTEV